MSTSGENTPTPSNTNPPMATSSSGGSGNKKSMYIVLIVLLVLLNGFFIFNYWNTKNEKEKIEAEKIKVEGELDDALADLRVKKSELEALSSENAELDSIGQALIAKLDSIELELLQAKKDAKKYKSSYYSVRNKLKEAESVTASMQEEINKLKLQIGELEAANDSLNTSLSASKEENELLLTEKKVLSEKVELGSLLKPYNVEITGVKTKSNSKEVPIRSARKAEKLKISFSVPENKVADPGDKTILVRLISPSGYDMAVESEGSGVFVVNSTGEQKQFTTKAQFNYNNSDQVLNVYWKQTEPFSSGTYKALFYQDGYLLTQTEFELK